MKEKVLFICSIEEILVYIADMQEEQSVYIMYVYYRIGFHSIKLGIEEFRSLSKMQVKFMHEKLEREMNIFNFMHILL